MTIVDRAIELLKNTGIWHLLWVSLIFSETLTFIIVALMSVLFHGSIRADFIATGAMTAFIATLAVTSLIIILVKKLCTVESALTERASLYQNLVELAPDAVVVHSGGKIVYANPAALKIVGAKSPNEFIGKPVLDTIHPDSRQAASSRISAIMANKGRVPVLEEKVNRLDGSTLDMELQSTYIEYDGKPSVLTMARDISERKMAAQAIIRAKEAAETTSRAKSDFISNISHELRTPLSVTLGFTQLLKGSSLSDDQKLYVNMIESSSGTLMGIINDILDFSRLERGSAPKLDNGWLILKDVVNAAAQAVSAKARIKGLDFKLQYDDSLPGIVKADSDRLLQVVTSLGDNAVKFTEKGEVGIIAASEGVKDGRIVVHFTIHDTGIGISKEMQSRIFESFTQADGSMTRKYGGLGLGTTISKLLVDMMGGRIWVESSPDSGSRFHFTIPFQYANGDDATP